MKYYPIELHTHTEHSDGSFKPIELIKKSEDFGYAGFFLTDHNTMSAHEQVNQENHSILIMKGIEWTTFHGHMLVLGCTEAGDWTKANLDNIDECIAELRKSDDVAIGIAHPFAIGNPVCTGCHWEYKVENWKNIDYIEIYNSANPQNLPWNEEAYKFWVNMINKGYRLACAAGRDWHRDESENSNVAVSYIGLDKELNQKNIISAIKSGKIYTSLAPYLEIEIEQNNNVYTIGDEVMSGSIILRTFIGMPRIKGLQDNDFEIKKLLIYNNKDIIKEENIDISKRRDFNLNVEKGILRIEVVGRMKENENTKLLISSPIYIF